ncbi:uncharacterized protein LOC117631528 isoform X1 [Prunus dulcis]|uniref:uncharacterized protein LOC117631528 isoform X1 n=1 Tax=Prunus dulcis TaxID=3755 RepID=UPI001483425D|nr:uncharacterized protein LOC117631528 isoform X1 [Prunus dulcis]
MLRELPFSRNKKFIYKIEDKQRFAVSLVLPNLHVLLVLRKLLSGSPNMGNKPVKQESEEIFLKVVPPLDRTYVRWLARDLERIHGFTPAKPRAVKPPDHYIEYMHLNGWLDVDLADPDLAHLFK